MVRHPSYRPQEASSLLIENQFLTPSGSDIVDRLIIDTKPIDTHLDLLRTIHKYNTDGSPLFRHLVNHLLVHDHYGGRWVLAEAAREMITSHATHGFVTEVQIYTTEARSVSDEVKRIDALRDGICLDLMPHAFKVLQSLMPIGAVWHTNNLTYSRRDLSLSITGGAREHNVGCLLAGQVETFAAVSLKGNDIVNINGEFGKTVPFPFRCLIVVGKGVSANTGEDKDVKGVSVKFESGESLEIDLESQRMRTPDGRVIIPPADVLHRGINLPLIEIIKAGATFPLSDSLNQYFQPLEAAYRAAELIDDARRLRWLARAYPVGEGCTNLINSIPREWWGEIPWQLQSLPRIQIGEVPKGTLVIP